MREAISQDLKLTPEEYYRSMGIDYIRTEDRLSVPMGQFQNWYNKLFVWDQTGFLGWRYVKGLPCRFNP